MLPGLKANPTIETASDFVNNLNASMAFSHFFGTLLESAFFNRQTLVYPLFACY
jgi:hypothetical protein